MANSPTRSLFSSVCVYAQKSSRNSWLRTFAATSRFFSIRIVRGFCLQVAELRAQIVAHHAVDHKRAVHFARRREDLSARQIPPLVRTDDAGSLEPVVRGIEIGDQIGSRRRLGPNLRSLAHQLHNLLADPIDLRKSARMPSSMICRLMFTMCACRIFLRFTTSVICMRDCNSLLCACTAKDADVRLVSRSSRISCGSSVRGRLANSSSTKA